MSAKMPDPSRWFTDLMAAHKTMWGTAAPPAEGPDAPAASTLPWLQAAGDFARWQQQAAQQMTALWSGAKPADAAPPGAPAPVADRRFAADAWRKDPRFDSLVRAYLGQSELMRKALAAAPLDERSKAQWGFMLRQVTDALSPANFLATNPEAMQTALETGGASLTDGMRLFMQDLAKGRVSMVDDTAFELGRNLAASPGSVVYENELMQLIQYAPSTAKVHARPLVIVPPCINKFYIFDLQPENSFVRYAVAQGHTVFMVSWRNVGPQQGRLRWDDYLEQGVMQAIDVARSVSRSELVNTLGFCLGGILLASALAVMAAKGERKAASMTLLATMLDFSDTGDIGLLVSDPSARVREAQIGRGGVFKGRELAHVFAALRANDLIWPYVVAGYLKGKAPPAFDLLYWNTDDANLPGPMFCWYLRNTYIENKLRVPGGTQQCGVPVDLGQIDLPTFLYASREDHIVPWQTAYTSTQLLKGDLTFVLGASGHVAGVINPPAAKKRSYWVGEVQTDAPTWLDQARNEPGSWWTPWSAWLEGRAGRLVPAPKTPGNGQFAVIEAAPGRYVKAKAP